MSLPERLAVHALVGIGGAVVLLDSASLVMASGYFPAAIGVALVALSAVSMVSALSAGPLTTDEAPLGLGIAGLAMLFVFIWSSSQIGFLTSSLWMLPAMALLGGDRRWGRIALLTGAFVILAWIVFGLVFAQTFPPELILGEL